MPYATKLLRVPLPLVVVPQFCIRRYNFNRQTGRPCPGGVRQLPVIKTMIISAYFLIIVPVYVLVEVINR